MKRLIYHSRIIEFRLSTVLLSSDIIQVWNFHFGQCLKLRRLSNHRTLILQKYLPSANVRGIKSISNLIGISFPLQLHHVQSESYTRGPKIFVVLSQAVILKYQAVVKLHIVSTMLLSIFLDSEVRQLVSQQYVLLHFYQHCYSDFIYSFGKRLWYSLYLR